MPSKSLTVRKTKVQMQSKSKVVHHSSSWMQPESDLAKKCQKHYVNSMKLYKKFFLDIVEDIEALQPSGFAAVQASRYFTIGVLPKFTVIPDPLTKKERERVERLLAE